MPVCEGGGRIRPAVHVEVNSLMTPQVALESSFALTSQHQVVVAETTLMGTLRERWHSVEVNEDISGAAWSLIGFKQA